MSTRGRAASWLSLGALASCGADAPPATFVSAAGPTFDYDSGAAGDYYFPETMGAGVALLDANGDGALDVYWVQSGPIPGSSDRRPAPTNRLFLGDGAGTFVDATAGSGAAAHAGYGMGACSADVNGDGSDDLFLTNVGPDVLLLGDPAAPGSFVDATPPALAEAIWTTACGFGDVDRDGHLDLGVVGYVAWSVASQPDCAGPGSLDYCSVELFDGLPDRLWKGDGRGGFVSIGEAWGFGRTPGRGLGLALVDLDGDGFVDAYVANDTESNRLYLNEGGLRFRDHTAPSGAGASADGALEAGMGIAVGDVNRDGQPDLVVTNFAAEPNSLFQNCGRGYFRERSRGSGIAAASMSRLAFGVQLADFDSDGHEDLFAACGHVLRHVDAGGTTFTWRQPNQLMLATGAGTFREEALGPPLGSPRVGRGSAVGDLDGDGRLDVVVSNSDGPGLIALNRLERRGAAVLVVELRTHRGTNTAAVGAAAALVLDDGTALSRWVRSGTSYLSQDSRRLHFAVPAGREARELRVRWPDGAESTHSLAPAAPAAQATPPGHAPDAGRVLTIVQP